MPLEDGEWDEIEDETEDVDFQTAEAADLGTQSPGPESVEQDSALDDTEPQGATQEEVSASEDPLPEFDPRVRRQFEGLLYLGKLEDEFEWLGHKFVIKTVDTGTLLAVGQITKEYVGTMGDLKAYQTAMVGACTVSVDGKSLPLPLESDSDTLEEVRQRFRYV